MNYKGVIIEESLDSKDVLRDILIIKTKIEKVTEEHKTPHLKQWTLHTIEILESKSDSFAQLLGKSLRGGTPGDNRYADFKNDQYHYIIYRDKVFKVDLKNPVLYKSAKEYGISLGIPEYQVDFVPKEKVWNR